MYATEVMIYDLFCLRCTPHLNWSDISRGAADLGKSRQTVTVSSLVSNNFENI